jgi:hypothetical protein
LMLDDDGDFLLDVFFISFISVPVSWRQPKYVASFTVILRNTSDGWFELAEMRPVLGTVYSLQTGWSRIHSAEVGFSPVVTTGSRAHLSCPVLCLRPKAVEARNCWSPSISEVKNTFDDALYPLHLYTFVA